MFGIFPIVVIYIQLRDITYNMTQQMKVLFVHANDKVQSQKTVSFKEAKHAK